MAILQSLFPIFYGELLPASSIADASGFAEASDSSLLQGQVKTKQN